MHHCLQPHGRIPIIHRAFTLLSEPAVVRGIIGIDLKALRLYTAFPYVSSYVSDMTLLNLSSAQSAESGIRLTEPSSCVQSPPSILESLD